MIIDTGVLVAAIDRSDRHHEQCAVLLAGGAELVVPVLALAEVAHFVGRRMGPDQEVAFLAAIRDGELAVEAVDPEDWPRIHDLVGQYADLGLGTTDASLVAACERLGETTVASLDHRHLTTVRPRHCPALTLVP